MVPEQYPNDSLHKGRMADIRATLRERAGNFIGSVEFLAGDADIYDPATKSDRPLEVGQRIARGMKVKVRRGRALVRLDDGSDIWLAADSTLDLSAWGESKRTLQLAAGKLLALVAHNARAPFIVGTSHGEVRALGTAFETRTDPDSLAVSVHHGHVRVTTPAGSAEARQGSAVQAIAGMPIRVAAMDKSAALSGWLPDLSPSKNNSHIGAAFLAVAKTIAQPQGGKKEKSKMSKGAKITTAVVIMGLIGAGVYHASSTKNVPQAGEGHFVSSGEPPAGKIVKQQMVMNMVGPDGKMVRTEANTPEEIAAMRAKMAALPKGQGGDFQKQAPGPRQGPMKLKIPGVTPAQSEAINRDVSSAVNAYHTMLDQGVPADRAGDILNSALNDSLKNQLGPDSDLQIEAALGGDANNSTMQFKIGSKGKMGKGVQGETNP